MNLSIINKALFILFLSCNFAQALELKEVEITSTGIGETLDLANINSYDKARFKVMAFEPVAVYSWLQSNNETAQSKVIQVPAQIVKVNILNTAVTIIGNTAHSRNIVYINEAAVDLNTDKNGLSNSKSYKVKTKYKFTLMNAQDIDRAKNLGEMQALRDIINRKSVKDRLTFNDEGYGSVQKELIDIQSGLLQAYQESLNINNLLSFEDINKEILYFKKNLLQAISNTYPDPVLSSVKNTSKTVTLNIDLGKGCVMGGDHNPVGSLCDLWAQLPEQFKDTVKASGLANGNNINISPKSSWDRTKLFIENPLFYANTILDDFPFPVLMFTDKEGLNHSRFHVYPEALTSTEINGGLLQIALPTSRSKDIAPIAHEMLLANLGVVKTGPDKRLLVGVTDAYSNVVLPDFFANAIIGRKPVKLSIFDTKTHTHTEIPLMNNQFLLTSKLVVLMDNKSNIEYKKNDFELVVWWGESPSNSSWKLNSASINYPTLPAYSDSKQQLDVLNYYRDNWELISQIEPFKHSKVLPTSLGAFASLMYHCVEIKHDLCGYNIPELNKSVVIIGDDFQFNNVALEGVLKPQTDKSCWVYDRSSSEMITCASMSKKSDYDWWYEIGLSPVGIGKSNKTVDLWTDLQQNTYSATVLKSEESNDIIKGKATIMSTIPATVW
jgi:hypothetical protein